MFPLTPGVWFLQPANDVDKVDLPSLHSAQILTQFDATAWLQRRICDQCRLISHALAIIPPLHDRRQLDKARASQSVERFRVQADAPESLDGS